MVFLGFFFLGFFFLVLCVGFDDGKMITVMGKGNTLPSSLEPGHRDDSAGDKVESSILPESDHRREY